MTDERYRLKTMTKRHLLELYDTYYDLCHGPNACYGVSDMVYLDMLETEIFRREEIASPPSF